MWDIRGFASCAASTDNAMAIPSSVSLVSPYQNRALLSYNGTILPAHGVSHRQLSKSVYFQGLKSDRLSPEPEKKAVNLASQNSEPTMLHPVVPSHDYPPECYESRYEYTEPPER